MLYSDAMAYNKKFLEKPTDSNFNLLQAFEGTEKVYAELELKIKSGVLKAAWYFSARIIAPIAVILVMLNAIGINFDTFS